MKIRMQGLSALAAVAIGCASGAQAAELTNDGAIRDYGQMLALNEGCKAGGIDHSAKIEALLNTQAELMKMLLQSPQLPADARAEMAVQLQRVNQRDYDKKAYQRQRRAALKLNAQDRKTSCDALLGVVESKLAMLQLTAPLMTPLLGASAPAAAEAASAAASSGER